MKVDFRIRTWSYGQHFTVSLFANESRLTSKKKESYLVSILLVTFFLLLLCPYVINILNYPEYDLFRLSTVDYLVFLFVFCPYFVPRCSESKTITIGSWRIASLKKIQKSHAFNINTEFRLLKMMLWPVATYGFETLTFNKDAAKSLEWEYLKTRLHIRLM